MIGVDTNVLLRLYVRDHDDQHQAAAAFFASRSREDPAYVGLVVLAEFIWALDRTYKYPRKSILTLLANLVQTGDVRIERGDVIAEALGRATTSRIDVSDAIIAMANAAEGCRATVTFDQNAARRLPQMELLA
jgi:predicted nucleic-acid-binding protein